MNRRKYQRRSYKRRKLYGKGLLGRDKWSRPPLYLTKQKGGFLGLAIPFILSALAKHNIRL